MSKQGGVSRGLSDLPQRQVSGALLIVLATLAATLKGFGVALPSSGVGVLFWLAILLLWSNVASKTRSLSLVLLSVGGLSVVWGITNQQAVDWASLLGANTAIVAMVVAVSFLSLVAAPGGRPGERPLVGRRGFLSTLLGVHLFGSVINLSAVFIYGDRAAHRYGDLDRLQTLALNRGMTAAAFWSPFFASMAVSLSYAPEAQLSHLLAMGVPMAALGLAVSYFELTRKGQCREFQGYPLHLESLWLPFLLAVSVLYWHQQQPQLSVLLLVTTLVPSLSIAVLTGRAARVRSRTPFAALGAHCRGRLPRMVNEITLFLSAGIMTQGLSLVVAGQEGWLLFERFGIWEAVFSLLAILATAVFGLHPIIGISLLASVIEVQGSEQTLLAMVFLIAWGIGTGVGPLSGINLSMHGRYGTDIYRVMRWNLRYAGVMCLLAIGVLAAGAHLLGA